MQNFPQKQPDMKQVIDSSRDVLIAVGKNPTFDAVASALSLYLALSSSGKRVSIVSPSPMTVEFNHLVGVDKISTNVSNGGRNLVVSFPYQEGSIEKVSYNIENNTFNLVIEPREGYPTITPDNLSYSFGGGTFDTIVTIRVPTLIDLDSIYSQNQNLFSEKQLINIDNNSNNGRFGKINFVEPNVASVSEMVTNLLSSWGLRMDSDIATNLLAGITAGSNNFTSPFSGVSTFEAASICMRSGARKLETAPIASESFVQQPSPQPYQFPTQYPQPQPNNLPGGYQQSGMSNQPINLSTNQPMRQPAPQMRPQTQPMRQPMPQQPQRQQPRMQPRPMQQRPAQPPTINPGPVMQPKQSPQQQPQKQEAPPDWLKPKIYKGSTLL